MQSMNELPGEVQSNPVQIDNVVENSAIENENISEDNLGLSEHESGELLEENEKEGEEDIRKKLRKIEKNLRKKNTQLTSQLYETQEQLKSYKNLFDTTYGNAYKDGNSQQQQQQPADEVEEKVKTIINRAQQEAQLRQMQKDNEELLNELGANIEAASEKYDDFDESFSQFANDIPPQQREEILNIIKFIPNAGDVVYALSKNPAELKRLLSLNPFARAKAFGKHAIDIASNSSNRVVSNAPKPLNGGNLRGNPTMVSDLTTMSYADMKAADKALKNKTRKR